MSDKKDDADAEDVSAHGAEGSEDKKKSPPLLLIIGGAVVLLLGIGAGLYFTGMLDSLLGKAPAEEHAEGEVAAGHGDAKEEHAAKKEAGGHGEKKESGGGHGEGGESSNFVEIPPMVVNLNTDDGTSRFLRLTVQLELEDPADHAAISAVLPRVIDQFQTYLRELRVKDLRGSSGMYRLQMELLWRVNQAADPVKVKDVLFQEILIQ